MRSLHELQKQFARGVLYDDAGAICTAIAAHGIEPVRRLNVYRNNVRENFLKTLEATFPVIARLAGIDWFRQTGLQYLHAHRSTSGNLHHLGQHFGCFLQTQLAATPYAYFADVAHLEWAYQEVLVAAEHPSFDPRTLSVVPPDRYCELHFMPHPALRLVASRYPILAIWQANRSHAGAAASLDLGAGGNHLVILRREDHVEVRELPAAQFTLLDAFVRGLDFENAAEAVLAIDEQTDLGGALARLIQLGTLVDFSLDRDVPAVHSFHHDDGESPCRP